MIFQIGLSRTGRFMARGVDEMIKIDYTVEEICFDL